MAKKSAPKKAQAPQKEASKKHFIKRLYVPGFGFVDAGELLTEEILLAWQVWTESSIEDFVKE